MLICFAILAINIVSFAVLKYHEDHFHRMINYDEYESSPIMDLFYGQIACSKTLRDVKGVLPASDKLIHNSEDFKLCREKSGSISRKGLSYEMVFAEVTIFSVLFTAPAFLMCLFLWAFKSEKRHYAKLAIVNFLSSIPSGYWLYKIIGGMGV